MMNDQIDDYGIYDYSISMMKMIKLIVDNLVLSLHHRCVDCQLYATSLYMYLLYTFLRHVVLKDNNEDD